MSDKGSPAHTPAALSSKQPSAFASGSNAPAGFGLRRSKTMDEAAQTRRPSFTSRSDVSTDGLQRRNSNFSDYSLNEARNILNPRPSSHTEPTPETSSLASLSLAFALLPAIAGALFKNGSSVVTDIMLLGLAGVFLHWSVTQPWSWYHAAQQVRVEQEKDDEAALDDDSEAGEPARNNGKGNTSLDDVPEEEEQLPQQNGKEKHHDNSPPSSIEPQQRAALRELYIHEILALLSCFAMPLVSAYLLHYIRAQLSRPSEGLVSNYNLTIFLLVSELRAFSHALKLVQSRTLHLQRIVHGTPFASSTPTGAKVEDMAERLSRLEARLMADEFVREQNAEVSAENDQTRPEQKAAMARDVRGAIQPELDALNRAVRRYEKKATLLQLQTDSRFSMLEARMDDAIALAAVAAKNSSAKNIFVRTAESLISLFLLPFNLILQLIVLPFRSIGSLFAFNKQRPVTAKHPRGQRIAKPNSRASYGPERVPTRVTKR